MELSVCEVQLSNKHGMWLKGVGEHAPFHSGYTIHCFEDGVCCTFAPLSTYGLITRSEGNQSLKKYVFPLLDNNRRSFTCTVPETGEHII